MTNKAKVLVLYYAILTILMGSLGFAGVHYIMIEFIDLPEGEINYFLLIFALLCLPIVVFSFYFGVYKDFKDNEKPGTIDKIHAIKMAVECYIIFSYSTIVLILCGLGVMKFNVGSLNSSLVFFSFSTLFSLMLLRKISKVFNVALFKQ